MLLCIHLLNLTGYQLFFQFMIRQTEREISEAIDQRIFSDEQLLEIKIPFSVPYLTSSDAYENIHGEVAIDGHYYSYVKRKFSKDTLHLLCAPNTVKNMMVAAKDKTSGSLFSAEQTTGNGPAKEVKKSWQITEYTAAEHHSGDTEALATHCPVGVHGPSPVSDPVDSRIPRPPRLS